MSAIIALAIALLVAIAVPGASANTSRFRVPDPGPLPKLEPAKSDEVRMAAEVVRIRGFDLAAGEPDAHWQVDCVFTFENVTADHLRIHMGFPFPETAQPKQGKGNPRFKAAKIEDFKAWVRGERVATRLIVSRQVVDDVVYGFAHVWPIRIKSKETFEVRTTYRTTVTAAQDHTLRFHYSLRTGGRWHKARIGRSQLFVDFGQPVITCAELAQKHPELSAKSGDPPTITPPGVKPSKMGRSVLEWDLHDFAPRQDLELCFMPAKTYRKVRLEELSKRNEAELFKLSDQDLRQLRNTVRALSGQAFREQALQTQFAAKWWYEPAPSWSANRTNEKHLALVRRIDGMLRKKSSSR